MSAIGGCLADLTALRASVDRHRDGRCTCSRTPDLSLEASRGATIQACMARDGARHAEERAYRMLLDDLAMARARFESMLDNQA